MNFYPCGTGVTLILGGKRGYVTGIFLRPTGVSYQVTFWQESTEQHVEAIFYDFELEFAKDATKIVAY